MKHRKRGMACMAALSMIVAILTPSTAMADSQRIVTLGADLTETERAEVLDFFNLTEDDLDSMEVIEVTNDDEREYLSDYLADDIIGDKTMSCSYIEPTTSGGINVETANLTYVTKNTISNALQTAGVENANIVVTAPYDVSGTGALTGVFMAYEATGEDLDEDAEDAATEELVESAQLEDEYGEDVTDVISDVKDEVDDDMSDEDIQNLVEQKASEHGVTLDDDAIQTIMDIASRAQSVGFDPDESTGFWGTITSFFSNIGDTISGWVSSITDAITGNDDEDTDDEDADEEDTDEEDSDDEGILGSLNTDVFELDDPDSDDTDETDDTDADGSTSDEGTDADTDTGDTTDESTQDDSTDTDADDATDEDGGAVEDEGVTQEQ